MYGTGGVYLRQLYGLLRVLKSVVGSQNGGVLSAYDGYYLGRIVILTHYKKTSHNKNR